ncbi:MAG: alpha/beta hydrolase [Gammaproteobacteria bacterium]|nr:MAG: alpha/beta hydrolase [Gammaproteobacteria bacterium]
MRIEVEKLIIETDNGNLEALLDKPSKNHHNIESNDYIAVCCHPHSLHGGTLTNKVVYTMSRAFAGKGIPSIRFNFRGVGASEGEYDDGIGEQLDLANVVSWMREQYPNKRLILGGFSFGSFVSIMASQQLDPRKLISIAPPIGRFDFSAMKTPTCPWTVIQGDEDELVKCRDVEGWVNQQPSNLSFVKLTGASHFFHGKLVDLRINIEKIIA